MALPLVADFGGGHAAGAGADVGRAVLLARVVQVAGLGSVQAVVLSGHRRLACRPGEEEAQGQVKGMKSVAQRQTRAQILAGVSSEAAVTV